MASSEMNLLSDFSEVEKLETASGDQKRNVQRASLQKADTALATEEQNGNAPVLDGSVSNGHPGKVRHIWELVVQKHEASGESFETIIEQISQALEQTATRAKRDGSDVPSGQSEIEKAVRDMVEETTSMIQAAYAGEDDVTRSKALSHDKSELFRRFERLVQVRHELLEGKCDLGKFVDEVCLILKYVVSQCFSDQDQTDTVSRDTEDFDGAKPSGAVTTDGTHDTESAKPAATSAFQTEADEEPVQSVENQTTAANRLQKPDIELIHALQHQDGSSILSKSAAYREMQSPASEASLERRAAQEESHLAISSEILAATDKLAECQETITILSKQLQALKTPATPGPPDASSACIPRTSSAKSDYKPQSLASILAEASTSPRPTPTTPTPQVLSKEDEGEVRATATPTTRSTSREQENGVGGKDSMQIVVVHPVFAVEPRLDDGGSPDPTKRRKKRGTSLLGRIVFRKRAEGGS